MCTLDDKLLGEKVHNYCSSSEGEDNDEDDDAGGGKGEGDGPEAISAPPAAPPQGRKYNTGPKGVLADYKHFKEMEAQKRREKMEQEKKVARNCMTARSHAEEEVAKKCEEEADADDEEFLETYRRQRMNEIAETYKKNQNAKTSKMFGKIVQLNRESFLDAVDNEDPLVNVVVLITESARRGCREITTAFRQLPSLYPSSKFCVITAAEVGTSLKFKMEALPAILVYKGGDVVGNFIRLCDDLGEDSCVSDLEGFLVEHGMLCAVSGADSGVAAVAQLDGGRKDAKGWRNAKDDSDDDDDDD